MSKIPLKLCKVGELVTLISYRSNNAENEISSWVTNSVKNRKYHYSYIQISIWYTFRPLQRFNKTLF